MPTIAHGQATPWEGMFQRLLAELDQRASPEWGETESYLPAAVYNDPDRYRQEVASLFQRLPLCLGHVDQLRAPGSMLARDIAGVPILLMRDATGNVGVFLNACRHRGARLLHAEDEVCVRSSLSCIYHGWTYDSAGALVSVPRREAFPTLDRAARGLRRLPSATRHGLIWAVLDPAAPEPDLQSYLGPLDVELATLAVADQRCFRQHAVRRAANWKLMIDAFLEVYHVKRLHAPTIGRFFTDAKSVSDQFGPHQRMLVAREGMADLLRPLPPSDWSPQEHATLVHLIFPNSILVYHPDYISHLGMFPCSPGESLFVHTMLIPADPADDKERSHWERSFDLLDRQVFNGEDLFVCEQIQRGLTSGTDEAFMLGHLEANVRRFHATVEAALRP